MLKILNKKTLIMAPLLFSLVACNAPLPTGDSGGTEEASIFGTITKEDGSVGKNGTILLKQKVDNETKETIVRSDDDGIFKFNDIKSGTYQIAFVNQSEQARKDGDKIAYTSGTERYGFLNTNNFDYDGDTEETFQVPSFNVGWKAELNPHDTEVTSGEDIKFTWAAAKDADFYTITIKDSEGNDFYKSSQTTETTWTWSSDKQLSNAGNSPGTKLASGEKYSYILGVTFKKDESKDVYLINGGSSEASFTTK